MSRNFEKIELRKEKVLSSIQNVLQQVDTKKINSEDLNLLYRIMDMISMCYKERVNTYLDSFRRDAMSPKEKKYFDITVKRIIKC
jgi:hypothetical protein